MSAESEPRIRDWHQIAVEMLMTDTDIALASVAYFFATDDQDAVARVVHGARETYESAQERRKTLQLSPSEAAELDDKMDRLRARLRLLGEVV